MHLLIPFASSETPACEQQLRTLRLPVLEKLLGRLSRVEADTASPDSLSPPHERMLARLHAMEAPDGCIAWAAQGVALAGGTPGSTGWAWVTPAHWDVGSDSITMDDPQSMALEEPESRALLASMAPYFAEDGMVLQYAAPQRWLAQGAALAGLPSASLDRVAGREISRWMPSVPALRRLQNEMQMLLYTHPVNDARSARRQATVNSFWLSGSGSLPASASVQPPAGLVVDGGLRGAALAHDWQAWAQAWAALDQGACRALLAELEAGRPARLTLCGERHALALALALASTTLGWIGRLRQRLQPATTLHSLHEQL